jgi:RNA polymerase sigma factor (sigma-70 family)
MEGVSEGHRPSAVITPEKRARLDGLFRERFAPLVRLGTMLTGSTHVAEELVMDAFARLAPRLEVVDEPVAYLRTSVVNGSRSHHRRLRTVRKQPVPRAEGIWDPEVDELWQRLATLRPDVRACVVLRFYEDLSLADIAAQLDLPVGTVKSHLHRAIATLRDLVTEEDR